ncbi:hypothetical protein BVD86_09365 [Acinetobacter pittii]|nr:hypothetical protein BVD86_09365 [Acinetobacter pittii]
MYNYTYFRHYFIMKLVTVIELSKQTGLTRSQIYYLNKEHNLINSEGKINLEDALNIITALKIKKKITNEENFRQILNMLHLQIIALEKQLDLANEREKSYIAELASYRQHLLSKITQNSSTHESDMQIELENNGVNTDENALNKMESESEIQAPIKSRQNIHKETKSGNEAESHPTPPESIYHEITSTESKGGDTELTRKEKEMIEQNDNALTETSLPTQHGKELLINLKKHRKSTAPITQKIKPAKPIYLDPASNKQKAALSINQPMPYHDDHNNEEHHD